MTSDQDKTLGNLGMNGPFVRRVESEDNATQGWRPVDAGTLNLYPANAKVYGITNGADVGLFLDHCQRDRVLAALQRPLREAALVEALRCAQAIVGRLIADDGDSHFFVVRQEIKAELLAYGAAADQALISPPGLSTG